MRTAILALFLAFGLVAVAQSPVPRQSKDLAVVKPDGSKVMLSSLKGKVVVVQFLLTTCPHCQAMSQMLTKLGPELGSDFQAVGAATFDDPDAARVSAYVRDFQVGFPVGVVGRNETFSYLGLSVMQRVGAPQVVVIDKKGVIRAQSDATGGGPLGSEQYLRELVAQLLKEPS